MVKTGKGRLPWQELLSYELLAFQLLVRVYYTVVCYPSRLSDPKSTSQIDCVLDLTYFSAANVKSKKA
jgi:hypothetical protein